MADKGEFPVSIILKALDRATGPLAKMGKPFEALGNSIRSINNSFAAHSLKMESFTKGFKEAGGALESAGLRMTLGVTVPLEAFRHEAIRAAADFEEAMNHVETATGATGDQMKALTDLAEKVGSTTTFSAHSAAEAMATLAREGMSTEEIIAKLPQITNLAAAAHMQLAQAASAVTLVLDDFNVPADKSSKAIDMIAKASQLTRGGLESFGEAMSRVGPISAAMNIPMEDTAAVIAAMGRAGYTGGRAGSALAKGISEILHPSLNAVRILTRLRINPWDVFQKGTHNLKGIIPLLETFEKHGATAADMMQIFGAKGGIAFQAVLAKGTPALRELEKQLKSSGGAAQKLGEIQERGLNAQLARMSNAFEHLGIAIGRTGIVDSLAHMVEIGTRAINWLAQMNPGLLKWGFILLGVAAAIGPVLGYMGLMVTGIGALLPFLSMLGAAFGAVMAVVSVMGAPILLVVAAIAAIAAGAYLVWKHWTPIKAFFVDLWDTVKTKFLDVWGMIREKLGVLRYLIPGAAVFDLADTALRPAGGTAGPSNVLPFAPPFGARAVNAVSANASRNETHLLVEFDNMPRGTKVKTKKADSPIDLTRGYSMETGG